MINEESKSVFLDTFVDDLESMADRVRLIGGGRIVDESRYS